MYHFIRKHDSRVPGRTYLYLHDDEGSSSMTTANAAIRVAEHFGYKVSQLKVTNSGYSWYKGRPSFVYSFKLTIGAVAAKASPTPKVSKAGVPCTIRRPNIMAKRPTEDGNTLYVTDVVAKPIKIIEDRCGGMLEGKAIYLPDSYKWEIIRDEVGLICLIAKKK